MRGRHTCLPIQGPRAGMPALLFAICLDLRVFQAGRRARFVALLENVLTEAVVARAFAASAGFAGGGVAGFAVHIH